MHVNISPFKVDDLAYGQVLCMYSTDRRSHCHPGTLSSYLRFRMPGEEGCGEILVQDPHVVLL